MEVKERPQKGSKTTLPNVTGEVPTVPGQGYLEEYLAVPVTNVDAWTREECPKCKSRRRGCVTWTGVPAGVAIPSLTLPIQVDCILADYRKKATGIQASVIAPSSVHVHEYQAVPDFPPETSLVIFPSVDAVTLEEVEDLHSIERLILIDSRWNNTRKVLELPAIERLRKVKLKQPPVFSRFWRYHSEGTGHISSIEALYYMVREYTAATGRQAQGRLEDLLFLFRIQLAVIEEAYDTDPTREGHLRPTQTAGKLKRLESQCGRSKKLRSFKEQIEMLNQQQQEKEGGDAEGGGGGGGGESAAVVSDVVVGARGQA